MKKINEAISIANTILLGKERQLKLTLCSVLAGGHILLEDVPGVGKTTLVYLISKVLGLNLNRIQFTNDLLPGDILGFSVYHQNKDEIEFKKGPIFGQMILADELNRATPKTQSALLQVMEEGSLSIEGHEFQMEEPFIIIATQNPFHQLGTFPLPESQLDRFFISLELGFPSRVFEKEILKQKNIKEDIKNIIPVFNKDEIIKIKNEIHNVKVSDSCLDYLLDIFEKGREELDGGSTLSPRGGKDLLAAAKSMAYIEERNFVLPEDIQVVAPNVLGHRVGGSKGIKYGKNLIENLLTRVDVSP